MSQVVRDLPHGTTIVAATCDHGVVLAGDRREAAGVLEQQRQALEDEIKAAHEQLASLKTAREFSAQNAAEAAASAKADFLANMSKL